MFKLSNRNSGVSEVIGFVLLISLAMFLSTFVFSMSLSEGGIINNMNEEINKNNISTFHSNFAATQSNVGYNESRTSFTNVPTDTEIKKTSNIKIYTVDEGSETLFYEEQLRALVTERDDRTVYTESGGSFIKYKDSGEFIIKTNPTVSYNQQTLTFPLLNFSKNSKVNSNSIQLIYKNIVTSDSINVKSDKIKIVIKGETYKAWGKVFNKGVNTKVNYTHSEDKAEILIGIEGKIVTTPSNGIESSGEITVKQGGAVDGSVSASGDVTGEDNISGNINENTNTEYYKIDNYITTRVRELEDDGQYIDINNGDTINSGDYYVDGDIVLNDETTVFDAEDGNITIAVDGDVYITDSAQVEMRNTSDNRTVKFIVNGEKYIVREKEPTVTVTDGHSGHHTVFAMSDTYFEVSNKANWSGVYYSPSSISSSSSSSGKPSKGGGIECKDISVSACIGGNSTVNGSIITGDIHLGQSSSLIYDENLRDYEIVGDKFEDTIRPDINYLHISTTTVEIKNN